MLTLLIDETPTYALGDVPPTPLTLALEDAAPGWTGVETSAGAATLDADAITLTLPTLDVAGLLTIHLTVTKDGARAACAPVRIVVEDPTDGWMTCDEAALVWADAPDDYAVLYEVLTAARTACESFAPAADPIPANYRRAQLVQAKAIWAAERPTFDNRAGDEDMSIGLYPLDWNVKQLLRPKTGLPGMF